MEQHRYIQHLKRQDWGYFKDRNARSVSALLSFLVTLTDDNITYIFLSILPVWTATSFQIIASYS